MRLITKYKYNIMRKNIIGAIIFILFSYYSFAQETNIGVINLVNPQNACELTSKEAITIQVKHFSGDSINAGYNIQLSYKINNQPAVSEVKTLASTLGPGDTLTYTFNDSADFSSPDDYNIKLFSTYLPLDTFFTNDTLKTTIQVYGYPIIDIGQDVVRCNGQNITLSANGQEDYNYVWSASDTTVISDTTEKITVSPLDTITYYVTATEATCASYDSVTVFYLDKTPDTTYDIGSVPAFCENDSTIINAGGGYDAYHWTGGTTDSTLTIDSGGVYWVTVTDTNGCWLWDSVEVNTIDAPDVFIGYDFTMYENGAHIIGTNGFSSYLWNTGSTSNIIVVEGDSLGIGDHTFWLRATNDSGCSNTDTIQIEVIAAQEIENTEKNSGVIQVFPNPTTHVLNVSLPSLKNKTQISLYDIKGECIMEQEIPPFTLLARLDIGDLPGGIYYLNVQSSTIKIQNKLFILDRQ